MPELTAPGPVAETAGIREAVCIHTKKIFDSCRDKDCIEDLRLYPTKSSQPVIDRAISIKAGRAELLCAYIDVEPVGFNRGFFTVDIRYFYRVTADAFVGASRPIPVCGLAVFDKRAILFGSEGAAKVFRSEAVFDGLDHQNLLRSNLPTAVVEAVDPIILSMKLADTCDRRTDCDCCEVPTNIGNCFGEELYFGNEGRRVFLTLGQFSIVRLERDAQLLIPAYDYCIPTKECTCNGCVEDDPCEVFSRVQFPVDEFFPPSNLSCDNHGDNPNCNCRTL